jgi:hypothetical protein
MTKFGPFMNSAFSAEVAAFAQEQTQKAVQGRFEASQGRQANQYQQSQLRGFKKDFDARTAKERERLVAANNALEMLLSNNPVGEQAVITQLAKLSGEVGALTDTDVARYGGSKDLVERAKQMTTSLLTGELTEANRKYLTQIARMYKRVVQNKISAEATRDAESAERVLGVPKDQVFSVINPLTDYGPEPKDARNKVPAAKDQAPKQISSFREDPRLIKMQETIQNSLKAGKSTAMEIEAKTIAFLESRGFKNAKALAREMLGVK